MGSIRIGDAAINALITTRGSDDVAFGAALRFLGLAVGAAAGAGEGNIAQSYQELSPAAKAVLDRAAKREVGGAQLEGLIGLLNDHARDKGPTDASHIDPQILAALPGGAQESAAALTRELAQTINQLNRKWGTSFAITATEAQASVQSLVVRGKTPLTAAQANELVQNLPIRGWMFVLRDEDDKSSSFRLELARTPKGTPGRLNGRGAPSDGD